MTLLLHNGTLYAHCYLRRLIDENERDDYEKDSSSGVYWSGDCRSISGFGWMLFRRELSYEAGLLQAEMCRGK
jgi:hypothetical protein